MRKHLFRRAAVLLCAALTALMLTACSSSQSHTFTVATGDKVEISLDTTDGYKLDVSEDSFTVSKDGITQTTGMFLSLDTTNQYLEQVSALDGATVLETGDGTVLYQYADKYNYITSVGSNTGVALTDGFSEDAIRACIDHLTIRIAG